MKNNELKLIEKEQSWDFQEYVYEYKGYKIREVYFSEEDCNHHNAIVYLGDRELIQYSYGGCLEKAIAYVDSLVERGNHESDID